MKIDTKKINIFDEIRPSDNELLSSLSKKDLEYLLNLINNYKLMLRDTLNIPKTETFGLEIECEHADFDKMINRKAKEWTLVDDISLCAGAELKSPALIDTKENWVTLRKMCKMVSKYSQVGFNVGGHIHVGTQILKHDFESLINFLRLWTVYEQVIFRFCYGEFLGPRPKFNEFSKSMRSEFMYLILYNETGNLTERELIYHLIKDQNYAVDFTHYDTFRTFEFRCPNGTFNPVIWQNNVNIFAKMLLYSNSKRFDKDTINEKLDRIDLSYFTASEIFVDDAVEFADLVFDNNLDKVYFLRQYLKGFEVSNEYEMAKTFC